MFNYPGSNLCYSGAIFVPRTPPFFGWKTRKILETSQKWSLWLHTKHLMDMFPGFWIRRPLTFWKYSIFHPLNEFSFNNYTVYFFKTWKAMDFLTCVPNFLFGAIYLSLLFNFKIGPSLGFSVKCRPCLLLC